MKEPVARTSRFAGGVQLENVLKKRAVVAPMPVEKPESAAATEAKKANQAKPASLTAAPVRPISATTGGSRRVPFNLPIDLHDALVSRKSAEGKSKTTVVLEAIEAAHQAGVLANGVEKPRAKAGGLFILPESRATAEGVVPAEIRLAETNCIIIDKLVATHELGTRTELIIRSLRFHLNH